MPFVLLAREAPLAPLAPVVLLFLATYFSSGTISDTSASWRISVSRRFNNLSRASRNFSSSAITITSSKNFATAGPSFAATAAPAATPGAKPPTGEEQIPPAVKSWNGKKAVITGYMVPVKMDKGLVTEFLLMRNTMACCFGTVPNMNEWVIVKMKKGVAPMMDIPVAFYGQLKVGAMFENGYMTGLYELDAEKMGEVQG